MSHSGHSHGGMNEHSTMASQGATTQMNNNMQHQDSHGSHGETGGHVMMFHLRSDLNLLFEPWEISSTKVLVGSCIAVLLVSLIYEGLKIARAVLMNKSKTLAQQTDAVQFSGPRQGILITLCNRHHLLQTVLHVVHVVLGYLLMLVVMTYQVYLGIAVIIGAGLGYYFFAELFSDVGHEEPTYCPNPTSENPALILNMTNFNDLEGKQHQPVETNSPNFAMDNKGFSMGNINVN